MTADRDDEQMLAAEYVLGVMPGAERAAFARRMATSKTLQAHVAYWEQQFYPMVTGVENVVPPPHILQNVEAALFDEDAPKVGWWQSLGFWRGLSVASIVGMLALGSALYSTLQRATSAESLVAQISAQDASFQLAALYNVKDGTLSLNRVAGSAISGRSLELWLIEGDNKPVSLGVLPPDERGLLVIPADLQSKFTNAVLAISDEPQGGSPTGQPTGAVLATGKLITI